MVSPTASESHPIPSNSLTTNPPTRITTSGRSRGSSRDSCGQQLAIIALDGALSPPPGALPGKQHPYILRHVYDNDVRTVEASQEAEDAWVATILELAQFNLDFLESCTPGYYNNEGKPSERGVRNGFYGAGSVAFFKVLADWRADGSLPGLELTR